MSLTSSWADVFIRNRIDKSVRVFKEGTVASVSTCVWEAMVHPDLINHYQLGFKLLRSQMETYRWSSLYYRKSLVDMKANDLGNLMRQLSKKEHAIQIVLARGTGTPIFPIVSFYLIDTSAWEHVKGADRYLCREGHLLRVLWTYCSMVETWHRMALWLNWFPEVRVRLFTEVD